MTEHRRVLITDAPWGDVTLERQILEPHGWEVFLTADATETTLCAAARDAVAIAVCWAKLTAPVIAAAANCRVICRLGIGLDNIDLAAATARAIPVTNVPDYCVEEVADHALGLLLALARDIAFFHHRTKQGEYRLAAGQPLRRLRGQTLGLLGLGRIGRAVVPRAKALGLTVIAYTPSGRPADGTCEMVTLEELFQRSDYLSLHAPLTPQSRHQINARTLAKMKPTAFVINTSRGGLIDRVALAAALATGKLAGAGLDVFDPEPPDLRDPLYQHERVIVTPHTAFVSFEALTELRTRTAQQILSCLSGGPLENVVNGLA